MTRSIDGAIRGAVRELVAATPPAPGLDVLRARAIVGESGVRDVIAIGPDAASPAGLGSHGQHRGHRVGVVALTVAVVLLGAFVVAARVGSRTVQPNGLTDGTGAETTANDLARLLSPGSFEVLPVGPLSGRFDPAAVWTGTLMLIWGGAADLPGGGEVPASDGAAYDPAARAWTALPTAPISARSNPAAVWTGAEMVVWGGSDDGRSLTDGAAYDPSTRTWRTIATHQFGSTIRPTTVWTGTEMIVLEGINGTPNGAAYNPATNTWRTIATPPGRSVTPYPQAQWTGSVIVAELAAGLDDERFVASYDPTTDTWQAMHPTTVPLTLLWDGTEILGLSAPGVPGSAWNPTTDAWRPIAGPDAGSPMLEVNPVWTGTEALFWAGGPTSRAYDPTSNRWREFAAGPLTSRVDPKTVWANGLLLSWSGFAHPVDGTSNGAADGIALRPSNDEGTPLTAESIDTVTSASTRPAGGSVDAVDYRDPPPVSEPTVLSTVQLVGTSVAAAIGPDSVVVLGADGNEAVVVRRGDGEQSTVPLSQQVLGSVTIGPDDLLYAVIQREDGATFELVAIPLSGPSSGQVVARWPVDSVAFVEAPVGVLGLGPDGIVDRRTNEQLAPYVNPSGSPSGANEPVHELAVSPTGLVTRTDGTHRWQLSINRDPSSPSPFRGESPPAPTADGGATYWTWLGPNVDPAADIGVPTEQVVAHLGPDGDGHWTRLPDEWEVAASDIWGTVVIATSSGAVQVAMLE